MARGFKTGGRQKGTSNKVTRDLREMLKELLDREFAGIENLLDGVDPKDRLAFIVKLLPYTLPKYESTGHIEDVEVEDNNYTRYLNDTIRRMIS